MPRFCLFALLPFLLLLGCSDDPETTIDDVAEKSKELIQDARNISEQTADRFGEEFGVAREKASEKISDSFETLGEE